MGKPYTLMLSGSLCRAPSGCRNWEALGRETSSALRAGEHITFSLLWVQGKRWNLAFLEKQGPVSSRCENELENVSMPGRTVGADGCPDASYGYPFLVIERYGPYEHGVRSGVPPLVRCGGCDWEVT